jgi:carbonic anhydrase
MRKRIMGIVDFRERMLPQYERRFEAPALSQAADALFLTFEVIDRSTAEQL